MATVAIICIAAVVVSIAVLLTIIVYNQMLLLNEVNKRLLLMTKEALDNERSTEDELQEALHELDMAVNNQSNPEANPGPLDEGEFHDADLD